MRESPVLRIILKTFSSNKRKLAKGHRKVMVLTLEKELWFELTTYCDFAREVKCLGLHSPLIRDQNINF